MNKTLVLITSGFPYGNGEQFLESEVHALAKAFHSVLVVPHKIQGEARPLPVNFSVERGFSKLISEDRLSKRIWLALLYLVRAGTRPSLNSRKLKAQIIASYYAHRSEQFFERLMTSECQKANPVLFYSYWFYPVAIGIAAIKRKLGPSRLSLVVRAHRSDLYEAVHGIDEFPFRREAISMLNRIFCISDDGAAHLRSKYNAANVQVSRLGSRRPRVVPSKHGSVITVASCSSVIAIKRVALIFSAINMFSRLHASQTVHWIHIGSGPMADQLKKDVAVAAEANLSITLKGYMSNDDVHRFYEQNYVDCFVNLSTSEGVPVSIMEAMAYQIPVVATNVGGVSEIVETGAGVLVGVDAEPMDVAVAIENLVMGDLLRIARANARQVWERKYDAAQNYSKFANELLSI
jgi:glycosyltransferase involved in cell wall biosynthesis